MISVGSQVQVLSDPPSLRLRLNKLKLQKIRYINDISWGLSLVGRAPALHAGGQEFDSPSLHHIFAISEYVKKQAIKYVDYRN